MAVHNKNNNNNTEGVITASIPQLENTNHAYARAMIMVEVNHSTINRGWGNVLIVGLVGEMI